MGTINNGFEIFESTYIQSQEAIALLNADPEFVYVTNKLCIYANSGPDFVQEWTMEYKNMNDLFERKYNLYQITNQNIKTEIVSENGKCVYSNKQSIGDVAKLPNYNTKPVVSSAEDFLIGDVTIAKNGKYSPKIANIVRAGYEVQSETIAIKSKNNEISFANIQTVAKSFPASYEGLESDSITDTIRDKNNGTQHVGHQTVAKVSACDLKWWLCTKFHSDNFDLYTLVASQTVPIN